MFSKRITILDLLLEIHVLAHGALVIQRALHGEFQFVDLEGLGDEIVRAELHRLDGLFHRRVGGDEDDGGLRQGAAAFLEHVEAGDLLHFDIRNDNLRIDAG